MKSCYTCGKFVDIDTAAQVIADIDRWYEGGVNDPDGYFFDALNQVYCKPAPYEQIDGVLVTCPECFRLAKEAVVRYYN